MAGFEAASAGGDISTDSLWAATGDIAVATGDDAASVLTAGSCSAVLHIDCGTPAWTTTPSLAGLTATGDFATTGAAIDWDLKDDCSSALSFDASCKAGILALVTTNCSEGVTMSGTLGVTGVLTATGGIELSHACQNTLTGSGGCLSVQGNVVYRAGGTDVPVADGGTGLSCLTTGSVLIGTGSSDVTLVSMVTKGHLLAGDGSGAPRALAVGSNCQVLTACSGEDTGMKWACASGGGVVSGGTDNAVLRADGTGGSTSQGSSIILTDANLLQAGNGAAAAPTYSFSADTDSGMWRCTCNTVVISAGCSGEPFRVAGNKVYIGNENANCYQTTGMTITQKEHDNEILALKSSDVTHGVTDVAERDTYAVFKKIGATTGGLHIQGFTESSVAFRISTIVESTVTSDTTGSSGSVVLYPYKRSGTDVALTCGQDNVFAITDGSATRFLWKAGGEFHLDCTSLNAMDVLCDVGLVRTLETTLRTEGVIKSKWDDFISTNVCSLIDAGLYSVPPSEGGLLNVNQLLKLHNGAVWQLYTRIQDQAQEIQGLQQDMRALKEA